MKKKLFRKESRPANPKIYVKRSPLHGRGVWARSPIKKGEFLIEYVGQVLTAEENDHLQSHTDDPNHTFSFGLSNGKVIDGGVRGNISRFINHSCDPNAEFQETDNHRLYIYAIRDIEAGEEIFFDYSLQHDEPHTPKNMAMYKCLCGSPKCRGTMLDLDYEPNLSPLQRLEEVERKFAELEARYKKLHRAFKSLEAQHVGTSRPTKTLKIGKITPSSHADALI